MVPVPRPVTSGVDDERRPMVQATYTTATSTRPYPFVAPAYDGSMLWATDVYPQGDGHSVGLTGGVCVDSVSVETVSVDTVSADTVSADTVSVGVMAKGRHAGRRTTKGFTTNNEIATGRPLNPPNRTSG
jgi:hypothetical protein